MDLLSNAVKFTPDGGKISIRIIQLEENKKGFGVYEIHVKDNGIGKNEEFASRIFDPFERERTSTVSQIQGTGLGMAITKNIIDMMGGSIWVKTQKGDGTEFIIRLEMHLQTQHQQKEKSLLFKNVKFEGKKVLLVEDNQLNREIAKEVLKQFGLIIKSVEDGQKAVENKDAASIPIIAMTANAFEEDKKVAFDCGMNGFVSKPINIDELVKVLQLMVNN